MEEENQKKPQPTEISKESLELLKLRTTEIPGLIPYPHTSGGALIAPEDQGKTKGRAIKAMEEQTNRELDQILSQMKPLIDQANALKKRVHFSNLIYDADIPFETIIGHHYFLYEKKDGSHILSMISPKEWGKTIPYFGYQGEVKLLSDHTWEVIEESKE